MFAYTLLLLVLVPLVSTTLTFVSPASTSLLQHYGAGQATFSLLLTVSEGSEPSAPQLKIEQNDDRPVVSEHSVTMSQVSQTTYNVSVELECDEWIGEATFQVSVDVKGVDNTEIVEAVTGDVSVLGITAYSMDEDGNEVIVSGDEGEKVLYTSYMEALLPARELGVVINAPAEDVSLKDAIFSVRGYEAGTSADFLEPESVWVTNDGKIALKPKPYRVGSGIAVIVIEVEAIAVGGESFETQIVVEIGKDPAPPIVVETEGEVEATEKDGEISFVLEIFNLRDVDRVYATIAGVVFEGQLNVGSEGGEIKFVSKEAIDEGVHDLEVKAEGGDGVVEVVMADTVELRVGGQPGVDSALGSGQEQGLSGASIGGIVGGIAAGIAILILIAGVVFSRWSARKSEQDESSFASGGGVPFESDPVYVARDVYGRGSVHQTQNTSV